MLAFSFVRLLGWSAAAVAVLCVLGLAGYLLYIFFGSLLERRPLRPLAPAPPERALGLLAYADGLISVVAAEGFLPLGLSRFGAPTGCVDWCAVRDARPVRVGSGHGELTSARRRGGSAGKPAR